MNLTKCFPASFTQVTAPEPPHAPTDGTRTVRAKPICGPKSPELSRPTSFVGVTTGEGVGADYNPKRAVDEWGEQKKGN